MEATFIAEFMCQENRNALGNITEHIMKSLQQQPKDNADLVTTSSSELHHKIKILGPDKIFKTKIMDDFVNIPVDSSFFAVHEKYRRFF